MAKTAAAASTAPRVFDFVSKPTRILEALPEIVQAEAGPRANALPFKQMFTTMAETVEDTGKVVEQFIPLAFFTTPLPEGRGIVFTGDKGSTAEGKEEFYVKDKLSNIYREWLKGDASRTGRYKRFLIWRKGDSEDYPEPGLSVYLQRA
jgi:hypothetical protein